MKPALWTMALVASLVGAPLAWAAPADEVRAVYGRFLAAQNARDLPAGTNHATVVAVVALGKRRHVHLGSRRRPGPDGKLPACRGLACRARLARATAVEFSPDVAYLHLPLVLEIGSRAAPGPDRLRFLVSVLGVGTAQGWRIAALFTTTERCGKHTAGTLAAARDPGTHGRRWMSD